MEENISKEINICFEINDSEKKIWSLKGNVQNNCMY